MTRSLDFSAPLLEGRLRRRYKRFFAEVQLGDGSVVVAHCANTGSMLGCAEEGSRVWLSDSRNPARSLRFTWELVESAGASICVNTAVANRIVAEALREGRVAELADYPEIRREVPCGHCPPPRGRMARGAQRKQSRIDFLLERPGERCLVEVKSVTLGRGGGLAAFPDSVTERGARHLDVLAKARRRGDRAMLLFVCARSDARRVVPADDIDPGYGRAIRKAARAGVELLAYRCSVGPAGVSLRDRIPVDLPALGRAR